MHKLSLTWLFLTKSNEFFLYIKKVPIFAGVEANDAMERREN
jgi:hypothetical protein